jgi:hypothetical protein
MEAIPKRGIQMKKIDEIMERIGPYLSDLDSGRKLLEEALDKDDPEGFLEERLRLSDGLLRADIRIILNILER